MTIVLTVGHSTRPLVAFIALLTAHAVTQLVDVRTVPRATTRSSTARLCRPRLRSPVSTMHTSQAWGASAAPDSPNAGWRNASFRGYADYMQTAEFAQNLACLIKLAEHEQVALMCAEAVPWRCHRSLIADALLVHGLRVEEIINPTRCQNHVLTSFATVNGLAITYPPTSATESAHADNSKKTSQYAE